MKNKHLTYILLVSLLFSCHTAHPMEHINTQKIGFIVLLAAGCGMCAQWLWSWIGKKTTGPQKPIKRDNLPSFTPTTLSAATHPKPVVHKTKLHEACEKNDIKAVIHLLSDTINNNPNAQNEDGDTPLHIACKNGNHEIVFRLLSCEGIQIDIRNSMRLTPLCYACDNNNINVVAIWLLHEKGKVSNNYPLHLACIRGYLDLVNLLLLYNDNNCMNINQLDYDVNPLLETCHRIDVYSEKHKNGIGIIKRLIADPYININQKSSGKYTVFHFAAHDQELLQLFLKKDSTCISEQQNDDGFTPLHIAVEHGNLSCVFLLLEHGADISKQSDKAHTPLSLACKLAIEFQKNKKFPTLRNNNQYKTIIAQLLMSPYINQQIVNSSQSLLASVDDVDIATLLLKYGASPNSVYQVTSSCNYTYSESALCHAASRNLPLLNIMINQYNGNIAQQNMHNQTILLIAFVSDIIKHCNDIDYIKKMTQEDKKAFLLNELTEFAQSPIPIQYDYDGAYLEVKKYHDFVEHCISEGNINPQEVFPELLKIAYQKKDARSNLFAKATCMYPATENHLCRCNTDYHGSSGTCDIGQWKGTGYMRYNEFIVHAFLRHVEPVGIEQKIDKVIINTYRNDMTSYYYLWDHQKIEQKKVILNSLPKRPQ